MVRKVVLCLDEEEDKTASFAKQRGQKENEPSAHLDMKWWVL